MGNPVKFEVRNGRHFNNPSRKPKSPIDKAKGYEVIWPQVSPLFDAARICLDPCFVYFIGEADDGPLKIGKSKDPIARLRTMQTGNPRRLRVEHVLLGDMDLEKLLHELWEPHAIHSARPSRRPDPAPGTEWFNSSVREQLLPIIAAAADSQVRYLTEQTDTYSFDALEGIVRDAHGASGFIAEGKDEVRFLAAGAGYAYGTRRSRI